MTECLLPAPGHHFSEDRSCLILRNPVRYWTKQSLAITLFRQSQQSTVSRLHLTYFKESDLDAIKEFQQRGNLIVINSGRALPWIVAPLEGYLLPDYMIAGTGSIIADSHQQILHEEPVSFTAIKKIINEYASDIPLTVHTKDNIFSCNQKKQYSLPITPISSIDVLKTEKLYGMSFHFKDNKSAKAFADWLEKSDHQEVRAFVNIQDVDMAWRDCSKGNAMNILCQKLGFMHEQVYAIGDAENDIDMLRATKHGYTFHHSPATVKQYAEGCVESVSELIDKILKIIIKKQIIFFIRLI